MSLSHKNGKKNLFYISFINILTYLCKFLIFCSCLHLRRTWYNTCHHLLKVEQPHPSLGHRFITGRHISVVLIPLSKDPVLCSVGLPEFCLKGAHDHAVTIKALNCAKDGASEGFFFLHFAFWWCWTWFKENLTQANSSSPFQKFYLDSINESQCLFACIDSLHFKLNVLFSYCIFMFFSCIIFSLYYFPYLCLNWWSFVCF